MVATFALIILILDLGVNDCNSLFEHCNTLPLVVC